MERLRRIAAAPVRLGPLAVLFVGMSVELRLAIPVTAQRIADGRSLPLAFLSFLSCLAWAWATITVARRVDGWSQKIQHDASPDPRRRRENPSPGHPYRVRGGG